MNTTPASTGDTPAADTPGLPALLAVARPAAGGFVAAVPPSWRQGRTAYGGLSAALALEAALRRFPDLPPLRCAQVAFIGPLAGAVTVTAELLRRGRTAAYVQADVRGEDGSLGLRALFAFMAPQPSHIDLPPPRADLPAPETLPAFDPPVAFVAFTQNFEFRGREMTAGDPRLANWARLRERDGLHPAVELLAVGDVLPPAAMALFTRPGPISSMTWTLNLLTPELSARDGWWWTTAQAESAQGGSSSQRMAIWNADGVQVASASQSVAVFA